MPQINDVDGLCEFYGVKDTTQLDRAVYKNTGCGARCAVTDYGAHVTSIVEGSDAEFGFWLRFPFTIEKWRENMDYLEAQVQVAWEQANDGSEE